LVYIILGWMIFKWRAKGEIITKCKMGWGHLKILFLRTMKPEKLNFTWKLSHIEQRQVD
jgi:hypothetical protein